MSKSDQSVGHQGGGVRLSSLMAWTISLIVCLLLLGGLEIGAQLHHRYKHGDVATYKPQHLIDFYRFYKVNPEYGAPHIRVNSAGFRNANEILPEKSKDLFRIVLMGGSTVWGDDAHPPMKGIITNEETMAAHLERYLNARRMSLGSPLNVQVINAGVMGYRLFQDVAYFDYRVAEFKPDLVIAIDGHNDLDSLQLGVESFRHKQDSMYDKAVNNPGIGDVLGQVVKFAETRSVFIRKLLSAMKREANATAVQRAEWTEQFLRPSSELQIQRWSDAYVTTARRFDSSVRIAGGRLLLVVQAEALGEQHKPLTLEEDKIREVWKHYEWLHTVGRERLISVMREASKTHNLWFEDISDVFQGERDQAYLDYTHLTSKGAQLVAERIGRVVEGSIFKH